MMGAALSLDSRAAFTQQLPLGPSSWQIYGCEGLAVITQLELAIWGSINLYESAHNLCSEEPNCTPRRQREAGEGLGKVLTCSLAAAFSQAAAPSHPPALH